MWLTSTMHASVTEIQHAQGRGLGGGQVPPCSMRMQTGCAGPCPGISVQRFEVEQCGLEKVQEQGKWQEVKEEAQGTLELPECGF